MSHCKNISKTSNLCQKSHLAGGFAANGMLYLPQDDLLNCEDLTKLSYMHNQTVLACILARYNENKIYTWAGPILVAVNPCQPIMNLYTNEAIRHVHDVAKEGRDTQIPHVFSVAGLAHHRLTSQLGSINQAILVSGESGAGKTESARFLLKYLTQVETDLYIVEGLRDKQKMSEPKVIRNRILASNPILEAFGNAATLRNHNSSRFGKLINLQYAGSQLKGASLDTYLLEKTRVTHQPNGERNFHIFYQVLVGCEKGLIRDIDCNMQYRITPTDKPHKELDDLECLKKTLRAFDDMGFSQTNQTDIFKILCAIMHLGNISFDFDNEKEVFNISNDPVCQQSLEVACGLLGINKTDLTEIFTTRKIQVPSSKSLTVYTKAIERLADCEANRDSLMQLLYVSIFSYLVATINAKTSAGPNEFTSYMGILDVYGFETFDKNSLEQLCINYANERLQQEFTRRYLASEQRVLLEEGFIELPQLITDNSKCVSALDSGVFTILNEECQLRRALNETTVCERVCNALQDTGIVLPPSSPSHSSGFVVRHYAGPVNYSSNGLLHKNKDEIPREIVTLLERSTNPFVQELTLDVLPETTSTPKKTRKITTLLKFKSSLDCLMKTLTTCDLHYIRCVKPNIGAKADKADSKFLLSQLNANGILETVKISQAGYPVRMLYEDFVKRYCKAQYDYSPKELTFLTALQILGDDGDGNPHLEKCRFGLSRIFMSESSLHQLENVRQLWRNNAATCIQSYYRGRRRRLAYRNLLASVRILQHYMKCRIIRIQYLRKKQCAIKIQKVYRGHRVRKLVSNQTNAAIVIQRIYRKWRRICTIQSPTCQSRLSMVSGYGSMCTDFSDIEQISRRIQDTEESGIETDTESLSGEKLKVGRSCRIRSRKYFNSVKVPEVLSDENDVRNVESRKSDGLFRAEKNQVAPSKLYQHISDALRMTSLNNEIPLQLHWNNRLLYYKSGIVSFRFMPPIKIRFHVRKTCLQNSTCAPYQVRPRGLLDAFL